MANLNRRRIFSGTTATAGVADVRASMFRELLHFDNVKPGKVEDAVDSALSALPTLRTIAGRNVTLIDVSGRLMSCDTALVTARYGANVFATSPNKDNVEMDLGFASVQWIQTPLPILSKPPTTGESYELWLEKYRAAIAKAIGDGDGAFHNYTGMPNGAPNVDASGRITAYAFQVPIWIIRIRTVLKNHPMSQIGIYSTHRVNNKSTTWSGFSFGARTLRFDGVKTRKQGDDWHVLYSFAYKGGGWYEQRMVGATFTPTDENGDPRRGPSTTDSDGNVTEGAVIENQVAAFGAGPMYKAASFETPGFPEG